jgi:hypothetical protein
MDLDGMEVCDRLTSKAITAALFEIPRFGKRSPRSGPYPDSPDATKKSAEDGGVGHSADFDVPSH